MFIFMSTSINTCKTKVIMPKKKDPEIQFHSIEPYSRLAPYYDDLMDYIDYDLWVEDVLEFIKDDATVKNLLDVSCGTGSMAVRFARAGLKVTAVDLSPEMIDQARKKVDADNLTQSITLAVGDMREIAFSEPFDVIINLHDGMNYLPNSESAGQFLTHAYELLRPNGWLVVDVVTPLLCETHFKGYREIFTDESGGYERETNYDSQSREALTKFTFEVSPTEYLVEEHRQQAYDLSDVRQMCENSPFNAWKILDDEDLSEANASSERFYVIFRKT